MVETKIIEFTVKEDERGSLIVLEGNKNIPFDIKRIYYIFNVPNNIKRGGHAHGNLQQIVISIAGSCKFLLDNGKEKSIVELNSPNYGLLITSMIWREFYDFSKDCVLMVLADQHYDELDYIRNYEQFLALAFDKKQQDFI